MEEPTWIVTPPVSGAGDCPTFAAGTILDAPSEEHGTTVVSLEQHGEVKHIPSSALLPRNTADSSTAPDLASLVHLNEPCIVEALRLRHASEQIYTRCGTILVAVNPWKPLPHLRSAEVLKKHLHAGAGSDGDLEPHPYGIARAAYAGVLRGERQSVLVSGESGAGKTETTKVLLHYLAASAGTRASGTSGGSGGSGGSDDDEMPLSSPGGSSLTCRSSVQAVLLDANPILEAFGNAKTLRNNNSSRFGKWVDVQFDRSGAICGGAVRTYLLEKSRAVAVPPGERSFHVFYQLLATRDDDEVGCDATAGSTPPAIRAGAAELPMPLPPASGCAYLVGGAGGVGGARSAKDVAHAPCLSAPGVDDAEQAAGLEAALAAIGLVGASQLAPLSRCLAAVLFLGNVEFEEPHGEADGAGNEGASIASHGTSQGSLEAAAAATAVPCDALAAALLTHTRTLRGELVVSPLSAPQARQARDSLAKALFGGIFARLVDRINERLASMPTSSASLGGGTGAGASVESASGCSVGVLDIFGFESFATNGFEQLCINFANEKLQGQFNQVTFEAQKREYEAEGVPWRGGSFSTNAETLALLEGRLGVVALLHEQCRLPKATDDKFVEAVRSTHASHASLVAPRLPVNAFGIRHYAGEVLYSSQGFLLKNRDALPEALSSLIARSECAFTRSLVVCSAGSAPPNGSLTSGSGSSGGAGAGGSGSLAVQFKSQLASLLSTIAHGESHYVRCVTPNRAKLPDSYDPCVMLHQLRCSGLIDAVRVAREGFPSRILHARFLERFRCLAPAALAGRGGRANGKRAANGEDHDGDDGAARDAADAARLVAALCLVGDPMPEASECQDASFEHPKQQQQLLAALASDDGGIVVGRTKVFLRLAPFHALEAARAASLARAARRLQSAARGREQRRRFIASLAAAAAIGRIARGAAARRAARALRAQRASIRLQAAARAMLARNAAGIERVRAGAACRVAASWRGHRRREAFIATRTACIALQCALRVHKARTARRALRSAARDVDQLRDENARLREQLRHVAQGSAGSRARGEEGGQAESLEPESGRSGGSAADAAADAAAELAALRAALAERDARLAALDGQVWGGGGKERAEGKMVGKENSAQASPPASPASRQPTRLSASSSPLSRSGLAPRPPEGTSSSSSLPGREFLDMRSLAAALPAVPPSPGALARAAEAEAQVSRLKAELRRSQQESRRQLDDAHRQLADARASLMPLAAGASAGDLAPAKGHAGGSGGGGGGGYALSGGLASVEGKMAAMEAEVERQRLELELTTARSDLEASGRKLGRQERIVSKLMAELREEKTRNAAWQSSHAAIDRLRDELCGKLAAAAAKASTLQLSASTTLATAAEHLASSAAADVARASDVTAELHAAVAASRLSEVAAHDARERCESRCRALERRCAAQARLVTRLLLLTSDQRAGSEDLAEGRAATEAQRMINAEVVAYDAEADGAQEAHEAHDNQEAQEMQPSPSSAGGLMGALAGGVKRAASAACHYVASPSAARIAGAGGGNRGTGSLIDVEYPCLLEGTLADALSELAAQRAELHAARSGDATLADGQTLDEEALAQAEALAAAEAAADALFASDGLMDRVSPSAMLSTPQSATPPSAAILTDAAMDASTPLTAGLTAGGWEGPQGKRGDDLRQQAAAAALVEELRLEGAKSARLERIIGKLMAELRAAKLHAAGAGGAQRSMAAFDTVAERLEAQLRDHSHSMIALEGSMHRGLEVVSERLSAISVSKSC